MLRWEIMRLWFFELFSIFCQLWVLSVETFDDFQMSTRRQFLGLIFVTLKKQQEWNTIKLKGRREQKLLTILTLISEMSKYVFQIFQNF